LSWACGVGPEAARERVRVARALPVLPTVSEAFGRGRLSYSKVRAITRVATPDNEALLTSYGLHATAAQLERIVAEHRRALDGRAAQRAHEQRGVSRRWLAEGVERITIDCSPAEAELIMGRIDDVADALGEAVPPPGAPSDGSAVALRDAAEAGAPDAPVVAEPWAASPPRRARRCDALLRLIESARPEEGPAPEAATRVVVHLRHPRPDAAAHPEASCDAAAPDADADPDPAPDAEADADADAAEWAADEARRALLRLGEAEARLGAGTPLPGETARRLACDAEVVTLVSDALGVPLGVGRRSRNVPWRLRRALWERDGGCRFPGCTATRWVDAHHVVFWSDGGATELDNLVLLCRHHHRLVHEAGYRVRTGAGQRFTFHRPDGTRLPITAPATDADPDRPAGRNAELGLSIDADTVLPTIDGTAPDYDMALQVLWQATFPAPPRP
jgi:hypothetical protein